MLRTELQMTGSSTHLRSSLPQLLGVFVLRRMNADTFVQVATCYLRYVAFLRTNACSEDDVFGDCCTITSWGQEVNCPSFCYWIVLC